MKRGYEEIVYLAPVRWEEVGFGSLRPLLQSGLFDKMPVRVAVIDPNSRYLFANLELLNFFGKSSEELLSRRLADVWGKHTEEAFCDSLFTEALNGQALR